MFNLKYMQGLLFTWSTDPLIIGKKIDVKKKSSPNSL